MKVTLANYTLTMMRGGGETRDLNLARELRLLGVDVTLVSVDPVVGNVRYPISRRSIAVDSLVVLSGLGLPGSWRFPGAVGLLQSCFALTWSSSVGGLWTW